MALHILNIEADHVHDQLGLMIDAMSIMKRRGRVASYDFETKFGADLEQATERRAWLALYRAAHEARDGKVMGMLRKIMRQRLAFKHDGPEPDFEDNAGGY